MDYRTAFVTGASSGLGEGIARHLAGSGIRVYAAARREERLAAIAAEAGEGFVPVVLDVTDTDAVVKTLREVDESAGGLDLVVANAGIGGNKRATRLTWEEWVEPTVRTNVLGAFATLTAILPRMVERDRGHLVGISSIAAVRGLPGAGAYSASKAALSTFLETLRVDLKKTSLRVTTVEPGFVRTPLNASSPKKMPFIMEPEEAVETIVRAILKGAPTCSFPWTLATFGKLGRIVPRPVYDLIVGR